MTTLFPEALAARKVANCQFCGRPLTDPESIARHAGPVCLPPPPKPPRPVADQPALPGMACRLAEPDQDAPEAPDPAKDQSEATGRAGDTVACQREACVILRFRGLEIRHEAGDEPDEVAIAHAVAAWMARRKG